MIDFALLIASLFRWMPFPLNAFAVAVFSVLGLLFLLKLFAFLKDVIPFF